MKQKGEDVGKRKYGQMVSGRYHCMIVRPFRLHIGYYYCCFMERIFDLHRKGIYAAVMSAGKNYNSDNTGMPRFLGFFVSETAGAPYRKIAVSNYHSASRCECFFFACTMGHGSGHRVAKFVFVKTKS